MIARTFNLIEQYVRPVLLIFVTILTNGVCLPKIVHWLKPSCRTPFPIRAYATVSCASNSLIIILICQFLVYPDLYVQIGSTPAGCITYSFSALSLLMIPPAVMLISSIHQLLICIYVDRVLNQRILRRQSFIGLTIIFGITLVSSIPSLVRYEKLGVVYAISRDYRIWIKRTELFIIPIFSLVLSITSCLIVKLQTCSQTTTSKTNRVRINDDQTAESSIILNKIQNRLLTMTLPITLLYCALGLIQKYDPRIGHREVKRRTFDLIAICLYSFAAISTAVRIK